MSKKKLIYSLLHLPQNLVHKLRHPAYSLNELLRQFEVVISTHTKT